MSNFYRETIHPETGVIELAAWIDGYFGGRIYGVKFSDGKVFSEYKVKLPLAESKKEINE